MRMSQGSREQGEGWVGVPGSRGSPPRSGKGQGPEKEGWGGGRVEEEQGVGIPPAPQHQHPTPAPPGSAPQTLAWGGGAQILPSPGWPRACRLTFCDGGDSRKSRPKGRFHSGLERERTRLGTDPRRGWGHTWEHARTHSPTAVPTCRRAYTGTPTNIRGTALPQALQVGEGLSWKFCRGGPPQGAPHP